jgi:hypothetical protein
LGSFYTNWLEVKWPYSVFPPWLALMWDCNYVQKQGFMCSVFNLQHASKENTFFTIKPDLTFSLQILPHRSTEIILKTTFLPTCGSYQQHCWRPIGPR